MKTIRLKSIAVVMMIALVLMVKGIAEAERGLVNLPEPPFNEVLSWYPTRDQDGKEWAVLVYRGEDGGTVHYYHWVNRAVKSNECGMVNLKGHSLFLMTGAVKNPWRFEVDPLPAKKVSHLLEINR